MKTLLLLVVAPLWCAAQVDEVTRIKGFAALWDFVKQTPDGRFAAHTPAGERADLSLDPMNYVKTFWGEGRTAAMADFPVIDEGPFGRAVVFRMEEEADFRPVLVAPRARIDGSGIDIRGAGRSVTLVAWVRYDAGNHAVAGIWHEGTDLPAKDRAPARVERGMRQYALFCGLAANNGGVASHVSENGASSFGDIYARHLSVTPDTLTKGEWAMMALVLDNRADTVTSYLNGVAREYWVESPEKHPFFRHAAQAWARGEYRPPRAFVRVKEGRLAALRVNPYWFPHDLYSPAGIETGGPFTIGRVIHMGRSNGFAGAVGGVAVFGRALSAREMRRLARLTP